jgi:Tfp pilus assembly protein PilX
MPLIPQRIFKTRLDPERGFSLPLVLGIGVIMVLLGVMTIARSSQNRIAAIAQKANAQSTAAAEHGVTHLQALLNRYPPLATACSDGSLSSDCGGFPSWKTLNNKTLDPCTTDDSQPIPWLQPYANREWKSSTTDPADGRFRLVSYEYKPITAANPIETGILVVEGQVNPDDSVRTATTQLKVEFKIARNPGLNSPPGLWIQDNQASAVSNAVALITDVRDSTCPGGALVATSSQQLQGKVQAPNVYQPTPGLAFPELPPDSAASASSTGTATSAAPASGTNQIDAIEDSKAALPNPTQPPVGNVLTYRVKAKNGQSIYLTDDSDVLNVGTGANTIVLDLEGGLTLTGGGRIRLPANTTLIVYAHGSVTLENKGTNTAIEQEGTPSATRAQVYVYPPSASPSDPTPAPYAVNLEGENEAETLYLALFAPSSKVISSAKVQGNIWAKSWEGTNAAAIAQAPSSPADLKLLWPPRISPITAWTVNP